MKKYKKYKKHKRGWLEPRNPDVASSFSWEASTDDWCDHKSYTADLTLRDCSRSIDFYCQGKGGLKKIRRLIEALEEFEVAALEVAEVAAMNKAA